MFLTWIAREYSKNFFLYILRWITQCFCYYFSLFFCSIFSSSLSSILIRNCLFLFLSMILEKLLRRLQSGGDDLSHANTQKCFLVSIYRFSFDLLSFMSLFISFLYRQKHSRPYQIRSNLLLRTTPPKNEATTTLRWCIFLIESKNNSKGRKSFYFFDADMTKMQSNVCSERNDDKGARLDEKGWKSLETGNREKWKVRMNPQHTARREKGKCIYYIVYMIIIMKNKERRKCRKLWQTKKS